MCWNESISLNTFLFSNFVLLLIIYNNAFTKYKIQEFDSVWVYVFFTVFFSIQLIEFFIWRNIKNKFYNHFFSLLVTIIIFFQPIFSLMILSNKKLRNILLIIYSSIAIPFSAYHLFKDNPQSVTSKNGNLIWKLFDIDDNTRPIMWIFWLFFFSFSLIYEKKWTMFLFGLITLCIVCYNYLNDNSYASMWCWTSNSIMIYYAFYLLLYLPFLEKRVLC